MFFVPPPFMFEALSHFLWPDSRDPIAGVAYEVPKSAANPLGRLSPAPAFTFLNFTIKTSRPPHKPFRRYWLRSLESEAASKKSATNKKFVLGRETAMIQLLMSKHHQTARPRSSSAVATTPHQSWDSTLPVVGTTRLGAAWSMTAEQNLSRAVCSAKGPLR